MSVPLDLFCKTLMSAMVKARHSVRIVTSNGAASLLGLEDDSNFSFSSHDVDILLLESWLTQQEEQHEVRYLVISSHSRDNMSREFPKRPTRWLCRPSESRL